MMAMVSKRSFLLLTVTMVLVMGARGERSVRQVEENVLGERSVRLVVRYRSSKFIISDGCPSQDHRVLQFYKYCLETTKSKTLCMKTDGFPLELPLFSNMCSALCHGYQQEDFTLCPRQAKVIKQVKQIEKLNPAVP